ncbi:hypothetical protein GCM10020358_66530 [Amorphoplanes nipponensis]|uniref:Outer membrane channel protein CpnT-like N-terminal domain-containing protein n=1 Tax=Actinoplanes nipponensis TaxID=135950 RepID=A0A919JM92_9ACTN|nr:hypothetical protein [Actinoplanes nipponensis]GIE51766.1 hypothetical protein Ani05nite_53000 [Actinoplanes nipponensis]
MTNPLIATAAPAAPSPWAGVWIAEDIEQIVSGVQHGSWIDGALGGLSAGLDALAFMSDPVGGLLQYGIAWLIEHVKPLSEALDWLAGDPAQIAAHAQTWRNVAGSLRDDAEEATRLVRWDLDEWTGAAAEAYRAHADRRAQSLLALGRAADGMALITEGAGLLIGTVRTMVRDAIATVVSRLIVYAGELLATAGLATPLVAEQVSTLCASWAARITHWLKSLIASLRHLGEAMRRLGEAVGRLREGRGGSPMGTRRDRRARSRNPGAHPQPPARTPDDVLPGGDPVYHGDNRTAVGYDSATMLNFDTARPEPGYHDAVVHGLPNGQFRPGLIGENGADVPGNYTHANQIAEAIRADPGYAGGPVRLVSCHTGRVEDGLDTLPAAQQVADILGVPVMAPTQPVGVPLRGGPERELTVFNGGVWKVFTPGGGA